MKTLFLAAALILITSSSLVFGGTASAQTDPAPELFINSAACYRSLIQADDLFCLERFQLPSNETESPVAAELWCQYLVDQSGCTGQPVEPSAPYSLTPGTAYITVYQGTTPLGQIQVPRIGYSVGGIYFAAGHGITWGDTTVTACMESSVSYFTTFEQSCQPVLWNTAANTQSAQRAQLGSDLKIQFVNLEAEDPLIAPNGYVVNSLINAEGRTLALEALNVMDRILPNTFQTESTTAITDPFATPSSSLQLQQDIDATAVAFKTALSDTGTSLGLPGDAIGFGMFAGFGIFAFWIVRKMTDGSTVLALVAFLTVMLSGTTIGAIPLTVAAVTALLIFAVGALWVLKKSVLN